jgi:hypothetical protein
MSNTIARLNEGVSGVEKPKTWYTLPFTKATYENIASILAFGFIDTNNSWFNYNTKGRAVEF